MESNLKIPSGEKFKNEFMEVMLQSLKGITFEVKIKKASGYDHDFESYRAAAL